MSEKERFYYDGLFYEDEESFLKAVSHHENSNISAISAARFLLQMTEEIGLNLFTTCGDVDKISNSQFRDLCAHFSIKFIVELRKLTGEE